MVMDNKDIVKQMMDLHKKSFESYFSMMILLQDQTEKIMKLFIDQISGMSEESKQVLDKWTSEYKKSHHDFKKAVDDGYAKVEDFFDYDAILKFQEQNEKMFNSFLDQTTWMPDDFKKATKELAAMYKKGSDDFKKYVDEHVNRLQDYFSAANKSEIKTKQKK